MELNTVIRYALDGDAILLLGARFSVGGTNKSGEILPTASELSVWMCQELKIKDMRFERYFKEIEGKKKRNFSLQ